MPRYPRAWLDELLNRTDIVQVISGYVPLKKNGRNYWGLCPFHGEKTASFAVNGERQFYYCFGCKAGGNVFQFVMDMEHCEFNEAVENLAEQAHMPPPVLEDAEEYERRRSQRQRLYAANRTAARFYHETLYRPEGEASLAYLKGRGLSDGVIRRFGLGASPDRNAQLTEYLLSEGFSLEELRLAGLTGISEDRGDGRPAGRPYDIFRNRAMFPIIDQYGNVIAFGGRSLVKTDNRKYVNTADTPVFNKRRGVYAANLLRKQRNLARIVLVEGYMDVISLSQFGVEGVCATLGTALTNEQARLLKRFAPQVYLAYDGDAAGQHAILRGLEIFRQEDMDVRVLDFPDGLDPDEYIRRDGLEGFRKLPAISPVAYRLRRMKEEHDLSTQDGRLAYARAAIRILIDLDPVERETYLKEIAVQTGFSREILTEQLRKELKDAPPPETEAPRKPSPVRASLQAPVSEDLAAQETLLSLLATGQIHEVSMEEKDFEDDELKSIYNALMDGVSPAFLIGQAPDEASRSRYSRILMPPEALDTDQMIAMARDCLNRIRKTRYHRRLQEITALLGTTPEEEKGALLQEAQELTKQIRKLS